MKTSELEGRELDWHVALAGGYQMIDVPPDYHGANAGTVLAPNGLKESGWQWPNVGLVGKYAFVGYPSSDWRDGGPIIEREKIELFHHSSARGWIAKHGSNRSQDGEGKTPLIAAMRAYVASKFGDEVNQA